MLDDVNLALAVLHTRAFAEQRRAATEQHRREVQVQLVDEAQFEGLADDIAAAHDHDIAIGRGCTSLFDRRGQIVDEGELHTQIAFAT